MILKSCLAAAFAMLVPVVAIAQTAPPPPAADPAVRAAAVAKFRQACAPDIQKFCMTAEKGKGVVRACLDSHAADLSDDCKGARAERAAAKQ